MAQLWVIMAVYPLLSAILKIIMEFEKSFINLEKDTFQKLKVLKMSIALRTYDEIVELLISDYLKSNKITLDFNDVPDDVEVLEGEMETPDYIKNKLLSIKNISIRERLMIGLRFGLDDNKPKSLQEIANRFQVTRERVRQIIEKVLESQYEEINTDRPTEEEQIVTKLSPVIRSMPKDEPLTDFVFSNRTLKALMEAGITTKNQLINIGVKDLFSIKGLGIKSVEELLIYFTAHQSMFTKKSEDKYIPIYEAKDLAIKEGYASPALFQRKLQIDYPKAKALVDELYEAGIIDHPDGAKPRRITELYKITNFPF